jgi:type IV pilus assembly protein PilB
MKSLKIGELLVQNNLVSELQVADALSQKMQHPNLTLGQVLCQMGYVKKSDLESILDSHLKRQKMGQLLLKRGVIDEKKLAYALNISREQKCLLGQALLKLHYIEEEHLAQCIASQHDLPYFSLKNLYLGPELAGFFNFSFAKRHRIAAINRVGGTVTLAMAFPLAKQELKDIERAGKIMLNPVISSESEIIRAQKIIYQKEFEDKSVRANLQIELCEEQPRESSKSKYTEEVIDAETEQLVKLIVTNGIRKNASDVHLERSESGLTVRYRIDGVVQSLDMGSKKESINSHARTIIAKIKVLSGMDIAEKRRPQDGSFKMRVNNQENVRQVDFRVSTLLTQYGEDAVIRILDKRGLPMSLGILGVAPQVVETLQAALDTPSGIFLVTGPTGSGKSATLHSLLAHINAPGVKSLTVEDPIEYTLDGVRQAEVNEAIGNTFTSLLRTFMRQDPDNIMIGEIRDVETAALAVRAALTGHTILSSLQTNDSTSAVTRLLDMGIEANFIASALRGVVAQRLVRINCEGCKEPYEPSEKTLRHFVFADSDMPAFFHGKGCPACNFTGFNGRRPIVELWLPTPDELLLINMRPNSQALRKHVYGSGSRMTMLDDGLGRVRRGETTLEELLRVVPYSQVTDEFNRQLLFRSLSNCDISDRQIPSSAKTISDFPDPLAADC